MDLSNISVCFGWNPVVWPWGDWQLDEWREPEIRWGHQGLYIWQYKYKYIYNSNTIWFEYKYSIDTSSDTNMISEQNKFRKYNTDKIEQSWRLDGGDKSQDFAPAEQSIPASSQQQPSGALWEDNNLGKKYT